VDKVRHIECVYVYVVMFLHCLVRKQASNCFEIAWCTLLQYSQAIETKKSKNKLHLMHAHICSCKLQTIRSLSPSLLIFLFEFHVTTLSKPDDRTTGVEQRWSLRPAEA